MNDLVKIADYLCVKYSWDEPWNSMPEEETGIGSVELRNGEEIKGNRVFHDEGAYTLPGKDTKDILRHMDIDVDSLSRYQIWELLVNNAWYNQWDWTSPDGFTSDSQIIINLVKRLSPQELRQIQKISKHWMVKEEIEKELQRRSKEKDTRKSFPIGNEVDWRDAYRKKDIIPPWSSL